VIRDSELELDSLDVLGESWIHNRKSMHDACGTATPPDKHREHHLGKGEQRWANTAINSHILPQFLDYEIFNRLVGIFKGHLYS